MATPSDEEVVSACIAEAAGLDWHLAVQEVLGTEQLEYVAYGSRIFPG